MNELQKRLLLLLKEIDEICKKHNITYYIDGGSAIGAIRHHGFIPWDDDIDIVMTRNNYNKFVQIIDKEIKPDRKFESFENNQKYTMLYARYCDKTTTSILRTSMLDVFESGVFIDIFILDPFPNDIKKRKKYLKIFKAYAEYVNPYYYENVTYNDYKEIFKMRILGKILGRKRLHKYINKKIFSYKEEDCQDYCFRFDLNPFIYPKSIFQEPRYMKFESLISPVPTKIEDYLKIHYGNTWMYIPNAENQDVHNVVTNLNVPYNVFKNDYYHFIPKDAIDKYKKFHFLRVKNNKLDKKVIEETYKLNSIIVQKNINEKLKKYNIKKLYNNKEYLKLKEIFEDYYNLQLDKKYIKNNIYIDIGPNIYYAILILINFGFYYKAKKIISVCNDKYSDLEELIKLVEKLNDYYYKCELDNYYELVTKYYNKFPDVLDFIQGQVKMLIKNNKKEKALKLIENSIYKYDCFLLKYKADILYEKDKEKAKIIYENILESCNNGILLLEVKECLRSKYE